VANPSAANAYASARVENPVLIITASFNDGRSGVALARAEAFRAVLFGKSKTAGK
jgi:hypothetical protein